MGVVELPDLECIRRGPVRTAEVASPGRIKYGRHVIRGVQLRLYEDGDGSYRVIASLVMTDKGSVEMVYDEGRLGPDALDEAVRLLRGSLGISGVVTRSLIALDGRLSKIASNHK